MPSDLTSQIDDFLGTLRARVQEVEEQRAQLREDYLAADQALKDSVRKAKKLISANDSKQGQKPKSKPGRSVPSEGKLTQLETYLREHANGSEFTLPDLERRSDWIGLSNGYTNHLLGALHERGVLRLVRTGHPDYGNRTKIWRLT